MSPLVRGSSNHCANENFHAVTMLYMYVELDSTQPGTFKNKFCAKHACFVLWKQYDWLFNAKGLMQISNVTYDECRRQIGNVYPVVRTQFMNDTNACRLCIECTQFVQHITVRVCMTICSKHLRMAHCD